MSSRKIHRVLGDELDDPFDSFDERKLTRFSAAATDSCTAPLSVRNELELTKRWLEESKLRERMGNEMIIDLRHQLRGLQLDQNLKDKTLDKTYQHRDHLLDQNLRDKTSELQAYLMPNETTRSSLTHAQDSKSTSDSSSSDDPTQLSRAREFSSHDSSKNGPANGRHDLPATTPTRSLEKNKGAERGKESSSSKPNFKSKVAFLITLPTVCLVTSDFDGTVTEASRP